MDANAMTGAETFLRLLGSMGVERIFASSGSEWAPVWEYLAKPAAAAIPAYLSARHEETAIGAASGYAKSSGKLPAVMLHTTVGALHGAMALRAALHESVPMVVFAGESVAFGEDEGPDPGWQWMRSLGDVGGPARLVAPCVKWSFGVNSKSVLPSTIQRACQLALTPPFGPAFVSVPMEYLFEPMPASAASAAAIPRRAVADPAGIAQLADMLAAAKNPMILTERSGRSRAAVDCLVELAQALAAPVVQTRNPDYFNFPHDHPLHAGFDPAPVLKGADMIFMPATVAPWHPASAVPFRHAKVALLDENPLCSELPVWGYQADLCLVGEVEASLQALLEQVRKRVGDGDPARRQRAAAWAEKNAARRKAWTEKTLALKDAKPMETRWIAHELNAVLPANAVVVDETITHRPEILNELDRLAPGGFFCGCIGGLGTGLATALGVKAAQPEKTVIATIGDGTFNYNPVLAALGFAQEHGMPIMIVVFDNQGYLSQQSGVPKYFPRGFAMKAQKFAGTSIRPAPEYAGLAPLFGGYGERVDEPGELRAALQRGLKAVNEGALALLDVRLAPVP
ncbi:MAG: hypothetical protein HYY28_02960 [Betaproteobacteria bacterium]|nr:hypothetical protein [Betaproteobacteria bacterium]